MALFSDTFVGTPSVAIVGRTGWANVGGSNFAVISATGAGLKSTNTGAQSTAGYCAHDTGVTDHYAEVIVGSGFTAGGSTSSEMACVRVGSTGAESFSLNYGPGTTELRIRKTNASTLTSIATATITIVAGDVLRLEAEGPALRGYVNGALILSATDSSYSTHTRTGVRCRSSAVQDPVITYFETDGLAAAVPPVLTLPTGVETGATTASGSVTTDKTGGDLRCLTTTNATEDEADLLATGSTQAVTSSGLQSVGAITGLTAATTYYNHFIHEHPDGNSNVASSDAFTTEDAPLKAAFILNEENGTTPNDAVTALQWAWWDSATPDLSLAADVAGTGASTDGSGVFEVELTGTSQGLAWSVRGYVVASQAVAWSLEGIAYASAPTGGGFNPFGNNKIRPARFPGKN